MSSAGDVVRRFWGSVWTEGNSSELHELFAEEMVENGEHVSVEAFVRGVDEWRLTFPDFSVTIEELVEIHDGRVVTRVAYRGTQHRQWAAIPATGRSFQCVGIDMFTIRDGRIVELWHAVDHYDMAVQLGGKLVPAGPPEAT